MYVSRGTLAAAVRELQIPTALGRGHGHERARPAPLRPCGRVCVVVPAASVGFLIVQAPTVGVAAAWAAGRTVAICEAKASAQGVPLRREFCITSFARYTSSSCRCGSAARWASSAQTFAAWAALALWNATQCDSVWMLCCDSDSLESFSRKSFSLDQGIVDEPETGRERVTSVVKRIPRIPAPRWDR